MGLVLGLRMMRALTPRSPKETQGERALFPTEDRRRGHLPVIARVNVSKCLAVSIAINLKSALDSFSGPWWWEASHHMMMRGRRAAGRRVVEREGSMRGRSHCGA
jgi:hypothetical protein